MAKPTQRQIATDIGLSESQVAAWVSDAEYLADGSGYRVFIKIETPKDVLELIPRADSTGTLFVPKV